MAEVVREDLELVRREVAVVPDDVVVAGPGRALDALVAETEKVME